jgi:TM2 domain-containing membrane protein YozV
LGGFGIHKFYLGRPSALWYLLFFWTVVPFFVGIIEGISYLFMTDQRFAEKFSDPPATVTTVSGRRSGKQLSKPAMAGRVFVVVGIIALGEHAPGAQKGPDSALSIVPDRLSVASGLKITNGNGYAVTDIWVRCDMVNLAGEALSTQDFQLTGDIEAHQARQFPSLNLPYAGPLIADRCHIGGAKRK